jgi:hypothetical protein
MTYKQDSIRTTRIFNATVLSSRFTDPSGLSVHDYQGHGLPPDFWEALEKVTAGLFGTSMSFLNGRDCEIELSLSLTQKPPREP